MGGMASRCEKSHVKRNLTSLSDRVSLLPLVRLAGQVSFRRPTFRFGKRDRGGGMDHNLMPQY